jgi:hypothetical protein
VIPCVGLQEKRTEKICFVCVCWFWLQEKHTEKICFVCFGGFACKKSALRKSALFALEVLLMTGGVDKLLVW